MERQPDFVTLRVAYWSPHGWPSPNMHHVPARRAEIPESFSGRMPRATRATAARRGQAGHTQGLACLCPRAGCRTPRYSPAPCQSLGEQHVAEELTNQRLANPDTTPLQGAQRMTKCPSEAICNPMKVGSFGHQQMWKGRNLLGGDSRENMTSVQTRQKLTVWTKLAHLLI